MRAVEAHEPPEAGSIDLSAFAFWTQPEDVRQRAFTVLRHEHPVSWQKPLEDTFGLNFGQDPPPSQEGYWAVVRHADVRSISRRPQLFCSGQGVITLDVPREVIEATQSILAMDAPRHTELRGLVSSAFTPRQVARIEDRIRANARRIVDEAAATGGGEFVELVAKRLPLMTISDMIGVPDPDREAVAHAADTLISLNDAEFLGDRDPLQVFGEALAFLSGTATELAAHRERHPRDDLMTALVQAEVDGQRLTHAEIGAFFVLLSLAGNDTTRHTTSHAMHALCRFPEERDWLVADLQARLPLAVEEFIRWATPVMMFRRTATRDTELHGQPISAGDKVVLFYISANRDEAVFDSPASLRLARDPNRHLSFGHGAHYCLGASLARTQLLALFGELLTRIPDVEVGEPEMLVGSVMNGVKRMPCSWSTARSIRSGEPRRRVSA